MIDKASSGTLAADESTPVTVINTTSYDSPTPQALLDFMLTGWAAPDAAAPAPIAHQAAFAARREALSRTFPADVLVLPTGHEKVRSNDTCYRFRPSSDFYYLTGNSEPDCVLVMVPRVEGGHHTLLFVEANTRSDATFFTDRVKGELWAGPRLGVEKSRARYGVDESRALAGLESYLEMLASTGQPLRVLRGFDAQVDAAFEPSARDTELATTLSEMRLIKDELELAELQAAVDSTARGFEDVIRSLPRARSERYVEGVFNLRARVEGNDVGYNTIAASGAHACVLHWMRNDGALHAQDLMLLDAGIEGNALYTADVTRTLPLSGRFSPEQRAVYDLVYKASRAALAVVRPGIDFMEPNRVAMRVLTEGLIALGILGVSLEEALREDRQLYRRYTLHNISHMLGLDVHDCAAARQEAYKFGRLRPGMVFTIEPGLYFQQDDLTVPERFRGIGVRIEDDVVCTVDGVRNLSANIPTSADDVEAWMARLARDPDARL